MKFFKEILTKVLEKEEVQVIFPNLSFDLAELVEMKCFNALQKIKTVIENNNLSDKEYFLQIEEIICILEELGSSGGSRHDFG